MVSETIPVNEKSKEMETFGGRLVAERERLRFKQVDVCARVQVSKTTQIKYEANERSPDVGYLMRLEQIGFDLMYLLTGTRGTDAMSIEHQNLLEAYDDAPEALKQAVFAALIAQSSNAVRNSVGSARRYPGYYRHEIKGEGDVRYQAARDAEFAAERASESAQRKPAGADGTTTSNVEGTVGQIVQGDATFNGSVDIAGSKTHADPKKKR